MNLNSTTQENKWPQTLLLLHDMVNSWGKHGQKT